MGKLPRISGAEAQRASEELGCRLDHQTGSHMILYRKAFATRSVPNHKELAPGLLRGPIRRSGVTVELFVASLA